MSLLTPDDDPAVLQRSVLLNLGLQPEQVVVAVSGAAEPPLPDVADSADWVTFFDVFPALDDDRIYRLLAEAKRILKPDGRIVFSFLDYDVPLHWPLFAAEVAAPTPRRPPLRFLNRPAIEAWARHLGLSLEYHYSGDVKWLQPLSADAAAAYDDAKRFGQSVAVLAKLSPFT